MIANEWLGSCISSFLSEPYWITNMARAWLLGLPTCQPGSLFWSWIVLSHHRLAFKPRNARPCRTQYHLQLHYHPLYPSIIREIAVFRTSLPTYRRITAIHYPSVPLHRQRGGRSGNPCQYEEPTTRIHRQHQDPATNLMNGRGREQLGERPRPSG